MRVLDCDCGAVIQAANDDELARRVREHAIEEHSDTEMDDEAASKLVTEKAYTATDS